MLECSPVAVSVPVSPLMLIGAYWTVTLQDLFGPSALPVQPLAVMEKTVDPAKLTMIVPEDLPPVLLSVKVCDGVCHTGTDPKSYWVSDHVSAAGALAACAGVNRASPISRLAIAPQSSVKRKRIGVFIVGCGLVGRAVRSLRAAACAPFVI